MSYDNSKKELLKLILKLQDNFIIHKNTAIEFLKRNGFTDIDIISENLLGLIKYDNKIYYISKNFGLLNHDLIKLCKKILKTNRDLVFLWPKTELEYPEKIPIFVMAQRDLGILVYSENKALIEK
ncbi:MAG: hypothetical protein ACTSYZ_12200 [Candidatus Helarchaeota archaeon]